MPYSLERKKHAARFEFRFIVAADDGLWRVTNGVVIDLDQTINVCELRTYWVPHCKYSIIIIIIIIMRGTIIIISSSSI